MLELGLLAAERPLALAAPDAGLEAIDDVEHLSAKGHVPAKQVPDWRAGGRHAEVIGADDPVELLRQPGRTRGLPVRQG